MEGEPGIHDVLTGARPRVAGYKRDRETRRVEALLPLTGRPMLVDFNEGAADVLVEATEVSAARTLSVEEIVSRHQQAQLTQDTLVRNYSASARMRQFFRPTITDSGYDVVTENRYFVEGPAVEWEELSFSVNGAKWEKDRPPFPLLQPEKILSLPLQLRFDEGYWYRLDGVERVEGYDCYVVRFEPLREDSALYRGTVWIDRRTFARIRVQAVQGGLSAPVVSNEETHRYTPAATIDNQPIFLFAGLSARQVVLIAGRNLLVEKDVSFSNFRVNDMEFERDREAARASERIMFRETDSGLRYYVKEGDTRVISDTQTSQVKAMAMGTYIDPSVCVSAADLRHQLPELQPRGIEQHATGAALRRRARRREHSAAQGRLDEPRRQHRLLCHRRAVERSRLRARRRSRIRACPDVAADDGTQPGMAGHTVSEIHDAVSASVRRVHPRHNDRRDVSAAVEHAHQRHRRRVGYRRGGYNVTINGTWYARSNWEEWGAEPPAGQARASVADQRTYTKYSVGVARNVFLGPFQKFYVNAAWFGGQDLDRFAQYQFGMFDDTRIHGVPASGVRFAELAMVRGSYSLNIFEVYRLDLFLEHAWGRAGGSDNVWQPLPGIGAAVNLRAPWNTILRAEVGQSWLPDRYQGLGSTTLQILLLKPLG